MQQTFELFGEYLSGSPSDKKLGKTLVFQTVDCIIDQWSLPKSVLTKMRLCLRACACVGIASKYREQNGAGAFSCWRVLCAVRLRLRTDGICAATA